MVRITGGELRGRLLRNVPDQGVRPTTGRVREAVFSMLGERVRGAWVMDLFAGSGVMGLEALSRGARGALFVEREGRVAERLRNNLSDCRMEARGEVVHVSVLAADLEGVVRRAFGRRFGEWAPFDLLFMDPPYGRGLIPATLDALSRAPGLLAADALVVAEHEPGGEGRVTAQGWHPVQQRRHGDTRIAIWRWQMQA
ncbi:MAG: 16S rRNA (guanine(966)-N(2))-methyltransferase RsmD [Magnetococcales bacterium]|nr:16S rRNA (guanine(966)-N(2))-methyltransferase RsmD [Magnetococcales bacterium]